LVLSSGTFSFAGLRGAVGYGGERLGSEAVVAADFRGGRFFRLGKDLTLGYGFCFGGIEWLAGLKPSAYITESRLGGRRYRPRGTDGSVVTEVHAWAFGAQQCCAPTPWLPGLERDKTHRPGRAKARPYNVPGHSAPTRRPPQPTGYGAGFIGRPKVERESRITFSSPTATMVAREAGKYFLAAASTCSAVVAVIFWP
jgi:hypothetical protein